MYPGQPMMQPGQPMMQPGQPMMQPGQPMMMQPGGVILVSQQRGHDSYPLIWGETPVVVTCHFCKFTGPTNVVRTLTPGGWCVCLILCLVFWPCVCVVCCIDSLNIYTHGCSNCGRPLGARNQGMSVYY